ncbi:hypothetical protein Hte_007219 [Hypoxylon texense]
MVFNIFANAIEESAKLGAQAIDNARRTHNEVLDATGVNDVIPPTLQTLNDEVYDADKNLVLKAGHMGAAVLRGIDHGLGGGPSKHSGDELTKGDEEDDDEEQDQDSDNAPAAGYPGPPPVPLDSRDVHYKLPTETSYQTETLDRPRDEGIDLRGQCPPVYNQQYMRSCTAHAVSAAFEFEIMEQGLPLFSPSRLYLWYYTRKLLTIKNATKMDRGVPVKHTIEALKAGVCSEDKWKYEACRSDPKTFEFLRKDAKAATAPDKGLAVRHNALQYSLIYSTNSNDRLKKLIHCLDEGHPFIFIMTIHGLLYDNKINADGHYKMSKS